MGRSVLSAHRGKVSAVLVTWNSEPYLQRCLDGIAGQTHRDLELIAIDNASSDGSAERVAPHAKRLIRNSTNRGFSAAVNQGLAEASGEFVLLVNPDCYLLPDYVERLVAVLGEEGRGQGAGSRAQGAEGRGQSAVDQSGERGAQSAEESDVLQRSALSALPSEASSPRSPRGIGAATGLLLRAQGPEIEPTGEIDSMGIRMTRTGRHLDLHQGELASRSHPSLPFEVFGVSGAAAMYRTEFLHDVRVDGEVFDEDFFAYREDADLAWRGRVLGWSALCEPRAIAHHVRRVTPGVRTTLPPELNLHSVKNRFLLRLKNEGGYLALRNAPFELARDLLVFLAALTIERSSRPAFAWLWRNRRRVLAKRRFIQSRRLVGDRDLARWFR